MIIEGIILTAVTLVASIGTIAVCVYLVNRLDK